MSSHQHANVASDRGTNSSPSTMDDLRLVVDYLRALRNEVAVDLHTISMTGADPRRYGKIPRPSRWLGAARRAPALSRWLQRLSMPLWGLAALGLFECHRRQALRQPHGARAWRADPLGQVLGLSERVADIVHDRHIDPLPSQWLELPWIPLKQLPLNAEVIRACDLLDSSDLRRVDRLARMSHWAISGRRGLLGWGLQSYTAWRWFYARLAVDKLPGPLLTTEHFDRWAVLADASAWAMRFRRPVRTLTLMQHGSVNAGTPARTLGIALPTRLRAVTRLHVYTSADAEVFTKDVLSATCCRRGVKVTYFRSLIELTDAVGAQTPSVLFVGHPLCADAHMALATALTAARADIRVFYKPHPTTGAGMAASHHPWTLVPGRTTFPRVDAVVSYPSTMVDEYAAHDIPAIVHPMDLPPDRAARLVADILQHVDSRRGSSGLAMAPDHVALAALNYEQQQ